MLFINFSKNVRRDRSPFHTKIRKANRLLGMRLKADSRFWKIADEFHALPSTRKILKKINQTGLNLAELRLENFEAILRNQSDCALGVNLYIELFKGLRKFAVKKNVSPSTLEKVNLRIAELEAILKKLAERN